MVLLLLILFLLVGVPYLRTRSLGVGLPWSHLLLSETGAATTDIINMYRYVYGQERLTYLAAEEIVLYRILQKRMAPMGGRGQWIIPIQTQNAGVWVGSTEGGARTTRRAQPGTAEATFRLQEFNGAIDMSWKLIQDSQKDEYAFERGLEFMDQSFRRRTLRLFNADLCGTGRGELASVSSSQDGGVTPTVNSLPFCDQGMIVDMMSQVDDDSTDGIAGRTISQIDTVNRQLTINAGSNILGSAANDYFTVADPVSQASGSLHTFGIRAWLDTVNPSKIYQSGGSGNTGGGLRNLGEIDRGTTGNLYWQSNKLSNSGTLRPFTEDLGIQAMDSMRERGGALVTDMMSDLALLRRYHESARADVFFALNSIKALGGVELGRDEEGMKSGENSEGETIYRFSGIPWRAEMFFAANQIIGFNREHFWIGHGANEVPRPIAEIFGEDKVPYFQVTPNTSFDVITYGQFQLLCDNPPAGFKITDVAES